MASQDWPPQSGEAAQAAVLDLACDWALANGLVLRPQTGSPAATTLGSKPGQLAIHAPFALYPSAFPRRLFQQALALQPVYNQLYADVTVDDRFLEHVIGGAVSKVDEFQGRLYEMWKQVKREGIRQVRRPAAPTSSRLDGAISACPLTLRACDRVATASLARTLQIRLPRPCADRSAGRTALDQAGRVQHHLGIVCRPVNSRRRLASVRSHDPDISATSAFTA